MARVVRNSVLGDAKQGRDLRIDDAWLRGHTSSGVEARSVSDKVNVTGQSFAGEFISTHALKE